MNTKQNTLDTSFTESERDVIKFAVWHYMFEAVDRINEIGRNTHISEYDIGELDICLDNLRDAVSVLTAFPSEEDHDYLNIKYKRKVDKIKKKFGENVS